MIPYYYLSELVDRATGEPTRILAGRPGRRLVIRCNRWIRSHGVVDASFAWSSPLDLSLQLFDCGMFTIKCIEFLHARKNVEGVDQSRISCDDESHCMSWVGRRDGSDPYLGGACPIRMGFAAMAISRDNEYVTCHYNTLQQRERKDIEY
ncbi:4-xylanase [Striga asiatica]|uniref:4-xylanase n=1 Tax=Striga asiatica TaxID=4170 RepID=A0A5A7Q320_STRAF|nr:4-xylanase [Striga asiatica]